MTVAPPSRPHGLPADSNSPPAVARPSNCPQNCSQTDNTISKLSKIAPSNLTISRKTLGFLAIRTADKIFRRKTVHLPIGTVSTTAGAIGHRPTATNKTEQARMNTPEET